MTTKEIRYVDYGIANNMGEFIEVNEDLKKYPKLFKAIMQHELAHTDIQGFNKEDFLVDMEETNINYWELLKFMCKYPRSFMQLAPFYKKNNIFLL